MTNDADATVFATSARFGYGVAQFTIPRLKKAGTYGVVLAATDLAGNFAGSPGTCRSRAEPRWRARSSRTGSEPAGEAVTGELASPALDSRRWGARGRSSTRARAASARPRSPPARRAAARPPATARWSISTDPAHSLSESLGAELGGEPGPGRRRAVGPGGQGPGGDGAPLVRRAGVARRAAHRARRGPDLGRGADRPARRMDELFALLRLQAHHESGEWDVVDRRLRADRRDAAAAVVPGRRPLVDRQGVPVRAPDPGRGAARSPARCWTSRCPARRCSPTSSGCRRT